MKCNRNAKLNQFKPLMALLLRCLKVIYKLKLYRHNTMYVVTYSYTLHISQVLKLNARRNAKLNQFKILMALLSRVLLNHLGIE